MELDEVRSIANELRKQIGSVVLGQERAADLLLVALLSEGHVLLEGMPGTAKTLLARTFAAGLALRFSRVQFTPDLMPGDVLGTNVFNFQSNTFVLNKGPIFTELLLADEINRTPPKTQSALLEAMQERSVTIDGTSHPLGPGFMVVATQNPVEHEGTYPLPEAQLDRFLIKIQISYPDRDDEREMVRVHGHRGGTPSMDDLHLIALANIEKLREARKVVSAMELSDEVLDYVVDIVRATREHPLMMTGASPRATNMLCLAARAAAALAGRTYVIPDDVKGLVEPVLGHRILLAAGAELEGASSTDILREILDQVAAPR